MRNAMFLSLALVVFAGVPAMAQTDFDVVVLYEGPPRRGTITEMSKNAVGLEVAGVKTPIELSNVRRVTFADAPAGLRTAQTSIANGQLEDAVEKLKAVDKGSIARDIVTQEVDYYLAYCAAKLALAGSGDKMAAARAMGPFAGNEGSYHFYEANELMGDLAAGLNRPDSAVEYYRKVGGAPWPDFKMRAAVLEGQALMAQGNYPEAYKRFEQVLSAGQTTPVAMKQKEYATLGKAVCLAEAGKPDDGIALAEKIIQNGDSREGELFARAYNALGACHVKAKRPKDALLAYLHVDLLFYQDPSQHAEALYNLRKLWQETGKADRALKTRALLQQRYPGSSWASKN